MVKASKLTHLQAVRLKVPGLYGDGAGLWLNVTDSSSKSWVFRFTFEGRECRMGLGPFPDVSIGEAREAAANMRKAVRSGSNPIEVKRERIAANRTAKANQVTFAWCSEQYIDAHKSGWKNAKHVDQWTNTLATYANPVIGLLEVAQIDTAHVMKILEPIWTTKAETASRLRGRIESVLDWATVRKFRSGENPARWKGHLDHLLPEKSKLTKGKHHPALPWQQMAKFMRTLQYQAGTATLALQFTILTAARSGEVRGMTWGEVDLPNRMWVVPAERMKAGSEHRVPLSDAALLVLERAKVANALLNTPLIFPGTTFTKPTAAKSPTLKPLSDMSLTAVLRRMEQKTITVHGFRSSFSDWAAEKTDYPRDMAEMALAHSITNKVEAAYRRGDMVEKRRQMMTDWAKHCLTMAEITDPNKLEDSHAAHQSL